MAADGLVGMEARLFIIVRAVVYLDQQRALARQGRSVRVVLGIGIERARAKHDVRIGVFVLARDAEHELVGGMSVLGRDPAAFLEI